ncbi:MAG: Diaminopimelate decarboxylase [Alphaproteobacteria bacterium MarineAlpha4_Bin2]|nr:MAG: Diaminopimelate decarboxylase [Alphaproteobacteria bacterium MarineAlpha4_Bin2]
MTSFQYKNGELHADGLSLKTLADAAGTPFYCYSETAIVRQFDAYLAAFAGHDVRICYAMKANDNLAVLRALAERGSGADVVSVGELKKASAAGVPADMTIFSGVGKTREELCAALDAEIMQINIESLPELEALSDIAKVKGKTIEIAIRVNPNIDAKTHEKISTGRRQDKFGINIEQAQEAWRRAAHLPGIEPTSVAVHIGSQLTSLEPFRKAFTRVATLVGELRKAGHKIKRVDLGGGLGIDYGGTPPPSVAAYAEVVKQTVGDLGCSILLEPGRNIVGNAGVLVTRVIYTKHGGERDFLIVDAAMNDLIRPALYEAHHGIRPVTEPTNRKSLTPVDVVGPICETGDTFARARDLPPLSAGDLLVLDSAGAYGAVMASTYNCRPHIGEVMVRGDQFSIVRRRQSIEDMMHAESFASWQSPGK